MKINDVFLNAFNDYLHYHKLTKEEFCFISNIDSTIIDKIIHCEHYVCIFDIIKLEKILKISI